MAEDRAKARGGWASGRLAVAALLAALLSAVCLGNPGAALADVGASGAADAAGAQAASAAKPNAGLEAQGGETELAELLPYADSVAQGTEISAETLKIWSDDLGGYLTYGTDYEIAGYYSENDDTGEYVELSGAPTEAGVYYVGIEGRGSYTGTTYARFEVLDMSDLSRYDVRASTVRLGETVDADSLAIRVFSYDENTDESTFLTYGTDYEISGYYGWDDDGYVWVELDGAPSEAGDYGAEIRGVGDYTGTTYAYFSILDMSSLDSYWAYAELDAASGAITFEFQERTVEQKAVSMVYDTDYTVAGWYDYVSDAKLSVPPS